MLQQRTTCVFNQIQSYDNIAEKASVGGLKVKKNVIMHGEPDRFEILQIA